METNGVVDLGAGDVAEEPAVNLSMTPEMFPGVWANFAELARTEHEVTLDFYRIGPGGRQGICVSRVSCSPMMLEQLEAAIVAQRGYDEGSGSAASPAAD